MLNYHKMKYWEPNEDGIFHVATRVFEALQYPSLTTWHCVSRVRKEVSLQARGRLFRRTANVGANKSEWPQKLLLNLIQNDFALPHTSLTITEIAFDIGSNACQLRGMKFKYLPHRPPRPMKNVFWCKPPCSFSSCFRTQAVCGAQIFAGEGKYEHSVASNIFIKSLLYDFVYVH